MGKKKAAKKRRASLNKTGIPRIKGIPVFEAWVGYTCIVCCKHNTVLIGKKLISPKEAYESSEWQCSNCGFLHSKESDLPFPNWPGEFKLAEGVKAQRFWQGFFRTATEYAESYWKQCNSCGRILPFSSFSGHEKWGPLERQMECRACKGGINAELNPKRTKQQLHESAVRRRIADLLVEGDNEFVDLSALFKLFNGRCFKTGTPLDFNDRRKWEVDHILPSKWLYPLSVKNAALLSKGANNTKKGKWPSEFYNNTQLVELAKLTGADLELISSKEPIINKNIDVNRCVDRYLAVRERSNLPKRITELKQILTEYDLVDKLSEGNKRILGFD